MLIERLTVTAPIVEILKMLFPESCTVNAFPNVATDAVTVPDCNRSVVDVAVVVMAASFKVALPYNLIVGPSR